MCVECRATQCVSVPCIWIDPCICGYRATRMCVRVSSVGATQMRVSCLSNIELHTCVCVKYRATQCVCACVECRSTQMCGTRKAQSCDSPA